MNQTFVQRTAFVYVAVIAVLASGCVSVPMIDPAPVTVAVVIKDTLPQICQAAQDNRVRANDYYANKVLSITAEVRSINEGFQPRYRVYMKADKIHVHAETENQLAAKQLSKGKTTNVIGNIKDVSYDYQGCSVTLKDARF